MNWNDIKVSDDTTHFLYKDNKIFERHFDEVLKFHAPGIAPVGDMSGAFHIDKQGKDLYDNRYIRTFGFYCNRASVIANEGWFHIDEKGNRIYSEFYTWTGNFQEDICTVRTSDNEYFYIDLFGKKVTNSEYRYCGDYKDGIACVKLKNSGYFIHIDRNGEFINGKEFIDLGVFHKKFATAKDDKGWFHIDINGNEVYKERYLFVEPFYNGYSLATNFSNEKLIIDEEGAFFVL